LSGLKSDSEFRILIPEWLASWRDEKKKSDFSRKVAKHVLSDVEGLARAFYWTKVQYTVFQFLAKLEKQ